MRKLASILATVTLLVMASCSTPLTDESMDESLTLKKAEKPMNFTAHLSGDQEVDPVVTDATGQAVFQLSKDGSSLSYKLIVANIDNVRMAHIHLAPAGQNGAVVAWLYPSGPPPILIEGTFNGVLAEGVITDGNVVDPQNIDLTLADVVDAMMAGNAYVNVHTLAFPSGEIRGQIK